MNKFWGRVKQSFIKKRLFWIEFFILIVFLIFFSAITVLASQYFYQTALSNHVREENEIRTESLEREISAVLDTIEEMSDKLINSNRLSPRSIEIDKVLSREMLVTFRNLYSYLDNVYYDYTDQEYMMTTWGYMKKDLFFMFYNRKPDEFQELISNIQEPLLVSSSAYSHRNPEHLLYIFPAINRLSGKRVTFIFRLNVKNMRLAMRSEQNSETEKVYILLPDHEILLSADNENYDVLKTNIEAVVLNTDSYGMIDLDGATYYYNKVVCDRGMIYIRLVSESVYLQQMSWITPFLILILCSLLLIGLLFIFLFFKKSYQPILLLSKILKQADPSGPDPAMDELQTIEYAITTVSEKNKQMKSDLETMRPIRMSRFVEQLITGHFRDTVAIQEACMELDIMMPYRYFAAVCLKITDTEGRDAVYADTIEVKSSSFCAYFSMSPDSAGCKGVANFSLPDKSILREELENFRNRLYEEKNVLLTISLGSITEDFRQLGYSYIAASSTLQYRFLLGDGKVLFYDEVSYMEEDAAPYPSREIHQLSLSVSEWDAEKISESLESIQGYITSGKVSLRRARYICLDIIGIFINAISVVNRTMAIDLHNNFDIFSLTEYNNVIHLRDTLELLSQKISLFIKENVNESTPRNTSLLIEYLKSNIGNHQFSIATMANNFSVSYKSMRKEFREETGHTLIEHFNYLKMEEVKRLLCTTQLDLNEIADQIGYNSACSLIREFKKETGITPGRYREING